MFRIYSLAVVSLLTAGGTFAQQAGQIVGTVTDSSGAVVPAATLKAIEIGTGFTQSTIAGSDGEYVLVNLRPTQYEVTAEAAGFRSFRRTGLELLANQSLTVNITLEVGSVSETVNISGAAVQVNTSNATISEVVDRSRIMDLVLNGRDVATLATLVPGMNVISVSRESGKSIPGGLQLSSNGTRNQQVSYRLDGTNNTDSYYQENQSFPFPDAVQEFSIQTSNYSAAHGNNAGAVVNVATRSGTNEFHGGVFEFVRNRVFNARQFFSPTQDFLKRNQFGGYLRSGHSQQDVLFRGMARGNYSQRCELAIDVRTDYRPESRQFRDVRRAVQPRAARPAGRHLSEQSNSGEPLRVIAPDVVGTSPASAASTIREEPRALPSTGTPKIDLPALLTNVAGGLQDVYFEYDRFDLSENSVATLHHNAALLGPLLADFPQVKVSIEGHCDERGSSAYNLALGDQRARRAAEFLERLGLPASSFAGFSSSPVHADGRLYFASARKARCMKAGHHSKYPARTCQARSQWLSPVVSQRRCTTARAAMRLP